jgi:hypothetical protein
MAPHGTYHIWKSGTEVIEIVILLQNVIVIVVALGGATTSPESLR